LGFQRILATDTLLEHLVNHNDHPSPCFSKVLIPKGFKLFRKNTVEVLILRGLSELRADPNIFQVFG
jgi:hypothetical protein